MWFQIVLKYNSLQKYVYLTEHWIINEVNKNMKTILLKFQSQTWIHLNIPGPAIIDQYLNYNKLFYSWIPGAILWARLQIAT